MFQPLDIGDCECIVKNYLNTENLSNVNFVLKPLLNENFELTITCHHEKEKKVLKFFAKSTSSLPKIDNILDTFREILPNFDTKLTPKVLYVRGDFVVFENLQSRGFQKCELLTTEHLFAALKILANFHAASLAFEETKSKDAKFRLNKEYALIHLNFSLKQSEITALISSVLEDEGQTPKVIEDLEERQFHSNFRKTLCHGNLISKNLMFKNENGATECKLLNIKSNFYAPPIYDVLQLIFFNTSAEVRQRHWKALLDHYYECLKEETKKHDVDISEILSFEDLHLSAHHILPLIKLEVASLFQSSEALEELKEVLNCPLLSKEDCYTIVDNKLATTDYRFLSFKVTPLSNVSGFLGQYHRLQIKILHLGEETTINCFIKSTPRTGIPMDIAKDLNSFSREVFMYETLVTQMKDHEIKIITECIPPCYFYRPNEFMVFEDMALLDYHNLDPMKPLDFPMLSLLIKTLAKFHASSIILEEKLSQIEGKPFRLINPYSDYFIEPLFFEDEVHKGARQSTNGVKSILTAVELLTEIQTETNQRNFRQFWPKFKELYYKVPRPSDRFRNVLCHGDLWTSNIMVKYQNDKPSSCVLFDFQIVRYCPPVYDLLSVLYLTTHRSTRLEYEDQLLKIYYEELGEVLSSYGISVADLYSYEEYVECFNYIRPHMLMHAAYECVLTMCTSEEISSFLINDEKCNQVFFEDRTEFITFMCEKSTLYRNRLKECILDIYDYCNSMCTK